ncbi:DUF1380 family protein [Pantoea ananatis]|uniref:DUF1380 family protein n=1 Tax=Pantoea ananas TaxID=553 RepID=UPI001B303F94|nr:DUF1380 family protein [Pantoea ananatis]MDN4129969.1 DUF1380 family protein [Pantoea ananatis]MDN4154273.1 DUF1380 family protein [Pantoea ananatis]
MYGTVKDLCSRLPEQYWPDQRVTLIIWTEDDVLSFLGEESLTEEDAADIVSQIDGLDGLHEYGVGEDTLRELHRNLQQEKAQRRTVTVSEATLATLSDAAERLAETGGDEDPSPILQAIAQAKVALKR